jgi:hypothetical protein
MTLGMTSAEPVLGFNICFYDTLIPEGDIFSFQIEHLYTNVCIQYHTSLTKERGLVSITHRPGSRSSTVPATTLRLGFFPRLFTLVSPATKVKAILYHLTPM